MNDTPSAAPVAAPPGGDVGRDNSQDRKAGYTSMPAERTAPKREERTEREFESGRQAADEHARRRNKHGQTGVAAQPVGYWTNDKSYTAPANETVDLNRAADDLKNHRFAGAVEKEIGDRDQIARQVDDMRKEAGAPTDPTAPVDPNQIDPHVFGDLPHQAPQIDQRDLQPQQHTPPPPGVDPEVHRLMQNKQVREHFEQEHGKVAQQVNVANDFAQAAFRSAFPELNNLRADQIVAHLNQMAKTNPARFRQAQALLDNVSKAGNARQVVEQQRAQREQQQFQTYSREQDAAFDRMIGQKTPQQRQEMATEMVSYAQEMGVDRNTLAHLLATNPIMRHSAFQKMIHDAVAGRLARKSLETMQKQQRAANIPRVQKPGTSNGGRWAVQSANLQQLSAKLSQTGDAKDAAAMLVAMRNSRRK